MRRVPTQGRDLTERVIPLMLIGAGLLLTVVQAVALPGTMGVMARLGFRIFLTVIGAGVALIACYVTASFLGVSFGVLGPAVLKLLGIYAFTSPAVAVVSAIVPIGGIGLVTYVVLYGSLLAGLFNLEFVEVAVFLFVLLGVNIGMVVMSAALAA